MSNENTSPNVPNMVEFRHVTKRFGDHVVLDDISLTIKKGQVVVLVGPSGCGKSTFLRCINALETIDEGDIIVDSELSVLGRGAEVRKLRRDAGMVFQQFNLFPQLNVLENVMFGPVHVRKMGKKEAAELAKRFIEKVGLSHRLKHYPNELSGGQQQRVAIARALALQPNLMLFDEATSALDPELRYEVLNVMKQLADEGMTMVVVTHEIDFARKVGDRLLFIDGGKVVHDGDPEDLIRNPPSERLRDFLKHVI